MMHQPEQWVTVHSSGESTDCALPPTALPVFARIGSKEVLHDGPGEQVELLACMPL